MPLYEFACTECGARHDQFFELYDDEGRDAFLQSAYHEVLEEGRAHCADLKRVFSFSAPADPIGDGYFDYSAGTYITSKRQLDDHNKAASDAATARLGIEHKFVATDIRELDGPPDDTGAQAAHDRQVKSGEVASKGRFVF